MWVIESRSGRGILRPGEISVRGRADPLPEWSFTTSARPVHHGAAEPLLQANLYAVYGTASAGTGIPHFAEPVDDPQADDAQPVPDGVAAGRPGAAGPA